MKKLVLSMMVAAFAVVVQAADNKAPAAEKPACCCAKKASMETKAECPMAKQADATCCHASKQATKKSLTRQALRSPKDQGRG